VVYGEYVSDDCVCVVCVSLFLLLLVTHPF